MLRLQNEIYAQTDRELYFSHIFPLVTYIIYHPVTWPVFLRRRSRTQWSDFLNRSPERLNIRIPDLPGANDQHFTGYAVRYLRPEVTRSWRVGLISLLYSVFLIFFISLILYFRFFCIINVFVSLLKFLFYPQFTVFIFLLRFTIMFTFFHYFVYF